MIIVALALLASAAWGASDFAGGLQTRSAPMPTVLVVSQAAGFVLLVLVLAAGGQPAPDWHQLSLAVAAGVLGAFELGLLYLAISRGPVIVVAPVAAAGAVLPVIAGALAGNHLGVVAVLGIVCALTGATAAAWEPSDAPLGKRRHIGTGALLALAAAAAIGVLLILFNHASVASQTWAAAGVGAGGLASATVLLLVAPLRRQILTPRPAGALSAMAGIGALNACGDLAFAFASAHGQLAIVAVLSSLYPVVTVLLAAGVLRERVRPPQAIGAIVALCGVVLLGAA